MGQCISGGSAGRRVDSFSQSSDATLPESSSESSVETPAASSATPSSSAVIKLLRRKNGRNRVAKTIIKSGKNKSPGIIQSGLGRRAIFQSVDFKPESMNKAEPGQIIEDQIIAQIESTTVQPHGASVVGSNKNTPSKKSFGTTGKSVTFLEPEIENKKKKKSKSRFRYRRSRKQPLKASNVPADCNEALIILTRASTRRNEILTSTFAKKINEKTAASTNGTESEDVELCKSNSSFLQTMGIHFSESNGESLIGVNHNQQLSFKSNQHLQSSLSTSTTNNNDNGAPTSLKTLEKRANPVANVSGANINLNNNNSLDANQNSSDTLKNINLIRQEIQLRRNLFFSSEESPQQQQIPDNMSGRTLFYKPAPAAADKDMGASKFSTRMDPKQSPIKSTATEIPKLYSVQSGHGHGQQLHQPNSYKSSSSSSTTTHSNLPVASSSSSSRLPVFSNGITSRSNIATAVSSSSRINVPRTTAAHPKIPSHVSRAPPTKYLDSADKVTPAGQWVSGNEFFIQKDALHVNEQSSDVVRRETLPSRFGQGNGVAAVMVPGGVVGSRLHLQDSSNNEARRGSVYTNWGSKLPMYNSGGGAGGVKKPTETVPFYMMGLYKNRAAELASSGSLTYKVNRTGAGGNLTGIATTSAPFSAVSTGVVKQRAIQYQTKISQLSNNNNTSAGNVESPTPSTPPSPLVRSSTYVKSTSPPSPDSNTPVIPDPTDRSSGSGPKKMETTPKKSYSSFGKATGTSPSRPSRALGSSHYSEDKENRLDDRRIRNIPAFKINPQPSYKSSTAHHHQNLPQSNYPLARDASTSSSVASSEDHSSLCSSYAAAEADKAISDSEFLIDDEISDQPELTLTFKDSSLILSPSSSGESLISCDLMLDYKESSCSGVGVSGDSVLLVDEPSLVGSPKESSKKRTTELCKTPAGNNNNNNNMVNTTSANSSSRRSLGFQQQQQGRNNGRISPIPPSTTTSTSPLAPSNKLSSRSSPQNNNRSGQQQQQQNDQQRSLYQSGGSHLPRRSSGLPVPVTPESKDSNVGSENHSLHHSNNNSPNNSRLRSPYSSSRSPMRTSLGGGGGSARNRTVSPSPVKAAMRQQRVVVKNNNKEESFNSVSKECENNLEGVECGDDGGSTSGSSSDFIQDILTEVNEYKSKLKDLLSFLEVNEKELVEKDEMITRQKKEIEYWKGRALEGEKDCFDDSGSCCEDDSIIRREDYSEDSWLKEKQLLANRRKETVNSAAQTENNYLSKPAVTYPEENDQVGQLVSFRIGRSSTGSNQS